MKYFKITRTWMVKAEDEPEAFRLVTADPNKYLDSESVTRTEYKKSRQTTSLGQAVLNQVTGSDNKR
jgi:hypothetical protein